MKTKGYFILEGIIGLGIFLLIINGYLGLIYLNFKVEKLVDSYAKNKHMNQKSLDYFEAEIKNGSEIKYCEKLGYRNKVLSYEVEEGKKEILYYFSGKTLYREVRLKKEGVVISSEGRDEFLQGVLGEFSLKNNLLRMNLKFKDKEEEYLYYAK